VDAKPTLSSFWRKRSVRKSQMASRIQEGLYDRFNAVARELTAASAIASVFGSRSLGSTAGSVVQQALAPTQSKSPGGGVLPAVSSVFTSGLGLAPLISGLFGLFGGGDEQPPPLVKYTMPERIYFRGAETATGIRSADYDQMGLPRAYPGAAPAQAAPQITVNVQAMDSQSFLDHSTEIAQAVRQAMLNLSPLNDVVTDV